MASLQYQSLPPSCKNKNIPTTSWGTSEILKLETKKEKGISLLFVIYTIDDDTLKVKHLGSTTTKLLEISFNWIEIGITRTPNFFFFLQQERDVCRQ